MRAISGLFAMLIGFMVVTADGAAAQEAQPELTGGQVEGFIASYPEARRLAEDYGLDERERAPAGQGESPSDVFGGVIADMKDVGAYDEFAALVRRHGFSGAEEWVGAANRIMMAYAVMSAEDSQGGGRVDRDMSRKLAETRREIEMSDMPPDQKQMALSQLDSMAGQMEMFDVPEADRTAVRPFMGDLDGIVEEE